MSAEHTPGPWKLETYHAQNEDPCGRVLSEDGRTFIADVSFVVERYEKANAALIVAAPDLLAALKDSNAALERFLNDEIRRVPLSHLGADCDCSHHRDVKRGKAAIEKATVRP